MAWWAQILLCAAERGMDRQAASTVDPHPSLQPPAVLCPTRPGQGKAPTKKCIHRTELYQCVLFCFPLTMAVTLLV